jgi:glycosyltransferase involved in cell wall biosynthesis
MKDSPRILFIATDSAAVIDNDYNILKQHFKVQRIDTGVWKDQIKKVRYLFSTAFHLGSLCLGIIRADIIFIWFANVEAEPILKIAKIFNKKTIVVIGGFEVAHEPEINYGRLLDQKFRKKIAYIIRNANRIIAVSDFSKDEILCIDPTTPVEKIYNSLDTDLFKPSGIKQQIVLSIAYVQDYNHIVLKGLDVLCKSAELLPGITFRIVGIEGDALIQLQQIAPSNVEILPPASQNQIIQYCQDAQVYCQLSYRESFGMALVEAMACECIPVVSQRGALPEIVGDYGYIVPYYDPGKTADAIRQALASEKGQLVREMTTKRFSKRKKEDALIRLLSTLT